MAIRNNGGMHGGGSGRRRSSSRNKADWSSSVIGSHASGSRGPQPQRRASAHSRRPRTSAVPSRRTGEVRQIHIQSRSVDERTSRRKVGQSRTESFMRHRDNVSRITLIIGIILIVVIALNLGTCAYRNSLSSSMALDDSSVSGALVSAKNDEPLIRCLLALTEAAKTSAPATWLFCAWITRTTRCHC